jgi:hypothetical protein
MKTFGCTVDKLVALFDITHFPIYTKLKKVGLKIGYIIPPNLTCFLLIQARGHILPITDFPEFLIAMFLLQQNRTILYASRYCLPH